MQSEVHEGKGGLWKAAGNSESFKVSKGACHRARVQGAYVYMVFENLTYVSGQPYKPAIRSPQYEEPLMYCAPYNSSTTEKETHIISFASECKLAKIAAVCRGFGILVLSSAVVFSVHFSVGGLCVCVPSICK